LNELHILLKSVNVYHTVQWSHVHVYTCNCILPKTTELVLALTLNTSRVTIINLIRISVILPSA